jgi:ABC-type polysaccharide/polyol phosphate export permease
MSHSVTESSNVVENQSNFITASRLTYLYLVLRVVNKHYIVLLHTFLPLLLAVVLISPDVKLVWILILPLLLAILFIAVLFMALTGVHINCFIRDTKDFLSSVFRIGFLATPIIWMEEKISLIDSTRDSFRFYIEFNPFYHLINMFRELLYGQQNSFHSIAIVLLVITSLMAVNLLLYPLARKKINSVL